MFEAGVGFNDGETKSPIRVDNCLLPLFWNNDQGVWIWAVFETAPGPSHPEVGRIRNENQRLPIPVRSFYRAPNLALNTPTFVLDWLQGIILVIFCHSWMMTVVRISISADILQLWISTTDLVWQCQREKKKEEARKRKKETQDSHSPKKCGSNWFKLKLIVYHLCEGASTITSVWKLVSPQCRRWLLPEI